MRLKGPDSCTEDYFHLHQFSYSKLRLRRRSWGLSGRVLLPDFMARQPARLGSNYLPGDCTMSAGALQSWLGAM